jgi:hypothetical protein
MGMPEQIIKQRARKLLRQGKRPTTAAGEFVREEIEHVRQGKHGARNTKQAIAIGLSKARRAGVPLRPPEKGQTSERTRRSAQSAYAAGQGKRRVGKPSRRRALAVTGTLKRERRPGVVSRKALSTQAKRAAMQRRVRKGRGVRGRSRGR